MSKTRLNQMKRRKRMQILYRRVMVCFVTMILVLATAIIGFHTNAKATNHEASDDIRCYASIEIQSGDSLWSIASEHMDNKHYNNVNEYIKDITYVNDIGIDTVLKSGEHIILPYYCSSDEVPDKTMEQDSVFLS